MNVQQNLNMMRKMALNLAREYKNRFEPKKAISRILKCNLFDISNLAVCCIDRCYSFVTKLDRRV